MRRYQSERFGTIELPEPEEVSNEMWNFIVKLGETHRNRREWPDRNARMAYDFAKEHGDVELNFDFGHNAPVQFQFWLHKTVWLPYLKEITNPKG